jgi:hypothetical protein
MKVKRAFGIVIIFLVIILGCESKKIASVPDNLIGVWGTSDPKYADRTFEITRSDVIFQTGEGTFDTYSIASIEMEKNQGENPLYTINYKNKEGLKYKFIFSHDPKDGGLIKFKNQPEITWTKEKKS